MEEKKSRYTPAQAKSAKKYLAKLADIKLRVTPEEKQEIEERAKAAGKSVNQYLKDLALSERKARIVVNGKCMACGADLSWDRLFICEDCQRKNEEYQKKNRI